MPNTKVANCLEYSADGVCKFCQHGYRVKNGSCVALTLKNCAEAVVEVENDVEVEKCVMCKDEIMVKDSKCDSEQECEIDDCDFCALDLNGKETCVICEDDKVIKVVDGI